MARHPSDSGTSGKQSHGGAGVVALTTQALWVLGRACHRRGHSRQRLPPGSHQPWCASLPPQPARVSPYGASTDMRLPLVARPVWPADPQRAVLDAAPNSDERPSVPPGSPPWIEHGAWPEGRPRRAPRQQPSSQRERAARPA